MEDTVFQRYEKKYLLNLFQYRVLMQMINGMIEEDIYGKYSISNIYFDTVDYELIRTSLNKPLYKEKIRLRSYGETAQSDDTVYVEIKKKYDGVVYKRRCIMTLEEAENYLYKGFAPETDCQIMHEIQWFTKRYELKPSVSLSYDRIAYKGREDDSLRITFDRNIRYRESELSLGAGNKGLLLMPEDNILMEVKTQEALSLTLSHIFSELKIFPLSFSKYGLYYQKNVNGVRKGWEKYA